MKNTLIVGIVGCGAVSRNHAMGYRECRGIRVGWVYDVNPEASAAFAKEIGARSAPSLESMCGEVAAVSICTPPAYHGACCLPFLKAGIPVLCEKPLAAGLRDSERLAAEVRRTKAHFQAGFTHRFHPPAAEAARLVHAGRIGRPLSFRNSFGGKFDQLTGHRTDPKISGGGVLADTSSHSADLFRIFMGEAAAVTAFATSLDSALGVEDTGSIMILGSEAGHGHLFATSVLPAQDNLIEIQGDEGCLRVNYYLPGLPDLTFQKSAAQAPKALRVPAQPHKFVGQARAFVRAASGGEPAGADIDDALAAAGIIDAAYRSARTGKTVCPSSRGE